MAALDCGMGLCLDFGRNVVYGVAVAAPGYHSLEHSQ